MAEEIGVAAASAGQRIVTLDVIRGVAVMGIFSVNIIAFAMPAAAYFNPIAYGGQRGADLLVWAANFILIDGKMRGLFTLLFGASTLLVIDRAEAAGLDSVQIHARRMAWLLIFGLAHYYLVWFGDILTLYAVMGMVAVLFSKAGLRRLIATGLALLAVDMLLTAGLSHAVASAEAGATGSMDAVREVAAFLVPPDPAGLASDLQLHRGGYAGLLRYQLTDGLFGPLYQLVFVGPEALGSILLGMAALRSGFLTGAWSEGRYRQIAGIGLAVGAAGYAWLGWGIFRSGFDPAMVARNFFCFSAPFRLTMMFGYAAAIILLARRGGAIARRVAATGRTAFTNYLGTSLVAAFLFNGWGLGLYARLGRAEAWLVVPCFWAIMLLWSRPWLDRYRYGPFEWAWRSLARRALQPMRR